MVGSIHCEDGFCANRKSACNRERWTSVMHLPGEGPWPLLQLPVEKLWSVGGPFFFFHAQTGIKSAPFTSYRGCFQFGGVFSGQKARVVQRCLQMSQDNPGCPTNPMFKCDIYTKMLT